MADFDVFNSSAFSMTSLTAAVDRIGYLPQLLTDMPGFLVDDPVRTSMIFIEERDQAPALILTDQRGAPPRRREYQAGAEKGGKVQDKRTARGFKTARLSQASQINSETLQGIRAFGSETELMAVGAEVARRQGLINRDMRLTKENMCLGLLQAKALDADGSTIYDWGTEFGVSVPAAANFDLEAASPASGVVRKACTVATRSIRRGLKGLGQGPLTKIVGLCGDKFWDDLTAHSEVRQTYLNTVQAQQLRDGLAFEQFMYGGINWINYQGTDDNTTMLLTNGRARLFPLNAGIFRMAYAPSEVLEFANTLGLPFYSYLELDPSTNKKWVDVQMFSYPLPVCTMPGALYEAKATSGD